jgi:hypothetical protein
MIPTPSVLEIHNALLKACNMLKYCTPKGSKQFYYLQTIEKVEDALSYFDANILGENNDTERYERMVHRNSQ